MAENGLVRVGAGLLDEADVAVAVLEDEGVADFAGVVDLLWLIATGLRADDGEVVLFMARLMAAMAAAPAAEVGLGRAPPMVFDEEVELEVDTQECVLGKR